MSNDDDFDEVYIATRESLVAMGLSTEHMGNGKYFFVQKNSEGYAIGSPISKACFLAMKKSIFNTIGMVPPPPQMEDQVRILH